MTRFLAKSATVGGGDKTGFLDFLARNCKKYFFIIFFTSISVIDGHFEHHYKTRLFQNAKKSEMLGGSGLKFFLMTRRSRRNSFGVDIN